MKRWVSTLVIAAVFASLASTGRWWKPWLLGLLDAQGNRIQALADLAVALEVLQVVGRGDEGHVHRFAEGALAELDQTYPVARARQRLEVADHLLVVGQLVVVSRGEAQNVLGSGDARPEGGAQQKAK